MSKYLSSNRTFMELKLWQADARVADASMF